MNTYERNGVHVDQCSDCRGIFLDRGELEQLLNAESRWAAGAPAPQQPQVVYQQKPYQKKRRSFLEELFD